MFSDSKIFNQRSRFHAFSSTEALIVDNHMLMIIENMFEILNNMGIWGHRNFNTHY